VKGGGEVGGGPEASRKHSPEATRRYGLANMNGGDTGNVDRVRFGGMKTAKSHRTWQYL